MNKIQKNAKILNTFRPQWVKMAKLGCYHFDSIWIIIKGQNIKELQGVTLAKSGALNGLR